MKMTEPDVFLQKCLKTITEEEAQKYQQLIASLSKETVQQIIATGEKFRSSSAVNGTWFIRIVPLMALHMGPGQLEKWLEDAFRIAGGNWESSLAFLKSSYETFLQLGEAPFLNWVKIGRVLCRFSSNDAIWFFKHGGTIAADIDKNQRLKITEYVLSIIELSWRAALASYKALPQIVKRVENNTLEKVLQLGNSLVVNYYDEAAEYFAVLPYYLQKISIDYLEVWVETAGNFRHKPGARGLVGNYFKYSIEIIENSTEDALASRLIEWVTWSLQLASLESKLAIAFLQNTLGIIQRSNWISLKKIVAMIEKIHQNHTLEGALAFIENSPQVLDQLDPQEMEEWVKQGLFNQKPDKKLAYFLLKSEDSRDALCKVRKGLPLENIKKVLSLYLEALTGQTVKIRASTELPNEIHGNDKLFCSVDNHRIYLPAIIKASDEDKVNLDLYKAMLMHQMSRKEFGTLNLSKEQLVELADNEGLNRLFQIIEDCRVSYLAIKKYPGLRRLLPTVSLYDIFRLEIHQVKELIAAFWEEVEKSEASAEATFTLCYRILELSRDLFSLGELKFPLYQNCGKLNYSLIYISKVLEEENCEEVIPSEKIDLKVGGFNPHSVFNIRLKKLLTQFLEDENNPYRVVTYYDEWDRTLNDFKKDWCKVREIVLKPSTGRFVEKTLTENYGMINTLKRYFGMLRPDRFRKYKRQADGDEVDIDAVIEAMVENKAGTSSGGGFYIRRDKRERDVAVGFLMDLSFSTNEVISNTRKTLLDLEQEAVIVMAEALAVLGDKYGIYGFTSDGREKINFYVVKDFEEAYSEEVKQRFGGLKSYGMTRLAAAIRHATNKLEKVRAAIKLLIILSDGKPFDFDYHSGISKEYEELYAEADTKMALRESRMKGINPFCITVDTEGQEYMEYIYGSVNYIIIDDVNDLPIKLTETYKNLSS